MNPSVESFSLVNFVEHLIKYKFLIIINLIIFFYYHPKCTIYK